MPEITIDLQDRLDELDDELDSVKEDAQDIDRDSEEGEMEFEELSGYYDELQYAKDEIEECIGEWEGSEFDIKKLSWGQTQQVDDLVRSETIKDGDDPRAKMGAYKLHLTRVAVCSTPPEAPSNPSEWPSPVGEYVYERVDQFNTRGDSEGNRQADSSTSSLEQALANSES